MNPPRVGAEEARHDGEEGGLAGTVRPEESDHLPRRDRQIDAAEHFVTGVGLSHPDHFEGCVIGRAFRADILRGCPCPDPRPHRQPTMYVRYDTVCNVQ